jgi:ABC-type multidrug transport system fused ATPase/permease subunit
VSIFKIFAHLNQGADYILIFFAILGSFGAGLTFPLMIYTTSEVYSNIGGSDSSTLPTEDDMYRQLEEVLNDQVIRQLLNGAFSFTCYFISIFFWSLIGNRSIYKLKKNYFTIILNQEQAWFDSNNPLEISTKVNSQLEDIEQGLGVKIGVLLTLISQCISGFIFGFISSWKLTLTMCSVLPVTVILANIFFAAMTKGLVLSRNIWGEAGGIIEEILYNIKTVASFANFEFEIKKFYDKVEEVWKIDLSNACKLGFAMGIVTCILNLCIFIAFIYGRLLIDEKKNIKAGNVISAMFCALIGIGGVISITPNIKMIKDASIAFSGYYNLYKRKPKIDLSKSIEKPDLSQIHGKVEFKNVSFYYPSDNSKKILDNIDLLFEPGKKVAIVGESGCGKSTIVNLIERLYDITEGQILIDGLEINRYDLQYLRNFIGYVQQEPVLFNKSIKDNIIFGREEYLRTLGNIDQLVKDVSEDVYITEFINNLPEKFNYNVGIKGSKLSGGQKQRVAIARAILANPKILILDEATSALDNISEKEVQRALDNISHKNVTTIIIAHRLSTVKNADLIYVIKNGKVLEKGNHNELLQKGGFYADLVKSQINDDSIKKEDLEEEEEIQKRRNTVLDVKFQNDHKIAMSLSDVSFKPYKLITELKEFKCMISLAIISACILGLLAPLNGYVMAYGFTSLSSPNADKRKKDGLKYAYISLGFSIVQGAGTCIMLWKFTSLGVTLGRIFRKKIFTKYLEFHLSYFDLKENAPGALVTKLSIDTMSLNQLVLTITGTLIQCICITALGLILGCLLEYRLTLIDFAFVPFIIFANILRRLNQGGSQNKKGFQGNIYNIFLQFPKNGN